MTSVTRELGGEQQLERFADTVAERFAEIHEREATATSPGELAARVEGLDALCGAGSAASVEAALP